jgi:hypothetical protein
MTATMQVKTKAKPKYAKVGDRVRIVEPLMFKRCGYPLDPRAVRDKFAMEIHELTKRAVLAVRGVALPKHEDQVEDVSLRYFEVHRGDQWNLFERAVVGFILQREGFGGRERTVHEVEVAEYKGRTATVTAKQTVMTGTYYAPSCGYNGYDYDYDPGGLEDMKAHVIYTLNFDPGQPYVVPTTIFLELATDSFEDKIDAVHCEIVTGPAPERVEPEIEF